MMMMTTTTVDKALPKDTGNVNPDHVGFSNHDDNVDVTNESFTSLERPQRRQRWPKSALLACVAVLLVLSLTLGVVLVNKKHETVAPSQNVVKDMPSSDPTLFFTAASDTAAPDAAAPGAAFDAPDAASDTAAPDAPDAPDAAAVPAAAVTRRTTTSVAQEVQQSISLNNVLELSCPTEFETSLEFTLGGGEDEEESVSKQTNKNHSFSQKDSRIVVVTNSLPDTLCTLVQVGTNDQGPFLMPVARSYSGHDWEVSAGKYKNHLHIDKCQEGRCQIHLNVALVDGNSGLEEEEDNAMDQGGSGNRTTTLMQQQPAVFQLTTFARPNYSDRDVAARFLEQATFGPTTELINQLTSAASAAAAAAATTTTAAKSTSSPDNSTTTTTSFLNSVFAHWIQTQMNASQVPIFSHRALYRRHLNARFPVPSPVGRVTQPCQAGTRYRRHVFTEKDMFSALNLTFIDNNNTIVVAVEGQVRTVVPAPLYTWSNETNNVTEIDWPKGSHFICELYYDGERSGITVVPADFTRECYTIMFADTELKTTSLDTTHYWTNPPIQGMERLVEYSKNLTVINIPLDAASIVDEHLFPYPDKMPDQLEIMLLLDLDDAQCANLVASDTKHPIFAFWNDNYYIYDPRFELQDNSMENPLPDGGGSIAGEESDLRLEDFSTMCANVPRTFLNEQSCVLSDHPKVCRYRIKEEEYNGPESFFNMTHDNIRAINEATRSTERPVYLYAIDGLDITRDPTIDSPCTPGQVSRWMNVACSNHDVDQERISERTARLLGVFIQWSDDGEEENPPLVLDISHPARFHQLCDPADMDLKGFEVPDKLREGRCWKNVHPDHLNVYDFSWWVDFHPGNTENSNPIREIAEAGNTTIVFPSWHEMARWEGAKEEFLTPIILLGHKVNFFELPVELRTQEVAFVLGIDLDSASTTGVNNEGGSTMVCGSPFEVANDLYLGGSALGGWAFDATTFQLQTTSLEALESQRKTVWTKAALEDPGQLRQRVAWALSQILVISPGSILVDGLEITEAFLIFYDIMVRHAFGNYRDILKEVSYSPLMAAMLTYYGGRSTAYVWENEGNIEFADENFAREVMQLFTTGAFEKLHRNGTAIMNDKGGYERVYSNDDIEEYARAWTGFVSHAGRGNVEVDLSNQIDPMRIDEEWRDRLPKMGLDQTYIGDGYPLCSDLPAMHFLAQGALYKLLGSKSIPELHVDPPEWSDDDFVPWLELERGSPLYKKLCGSRNGTNCSFASMVVLDKKLECYGQECVVDTIRTVRVGGVFYEYVRKPCVHKAFFDQAKMVVPRLDWYNAMCADPRTEGGIAACCNESDVSSDLWKELYFGERVSFATAQDRCGAEESICREMRRPSCDEEVEGIGIRCYGNEYFWTADSCKLKAKIDKRTGKVGIVHEPATLEWNETASIVNADTKTFFRVDWEGDFQDVLSACGTLGSCVETEDDACICDVSVTDEQVFFGSTLPRPDDVLSSLTFGAFEQYGNAVAATANGINAYNLADDGQLLAESVFDVIDNFGRRHLRKNLKSKVFIVGTEVSFRNPVHFISLSDPEPRDAHYETDAALDHYVYHPNTAPFLAIRFAQRFGISNPSPRYVEAIAAAFISGTFNFTDQKGETVSFGSGKYGDLASTFACVLLDREARDVNLDNDPAHGSLKEPLIKVIGLMRALNFKSNDEYPWVQFDSILGERIGQMAHEIPNVFSFFLPEYQPSGPVAQAFIVAPEAQVLTGPRIINSLNGVFSLVKYGLTACIGGFAAVDDSSSLDCTSDGKGSIKNTGNLTYVPDGELHDSPKAVVNELATLLTAGRLGPENRRLIEEVYAESETDAVARAQLLMAASPEFHITNLARQSGRRRPNIAPPTASSNSYKAVVYVLLQGGVDSFNMLAPHTCNVTNSDGLTLLEQYEQERTTIAITDEERNRIINATGQPCDQFAIHQDLPVIERLYNEGDLAFFANVGQLDMPVTKDNYFMSRTELFAHNTMQDQAQRIDPWDKSPHTGILGRMCDVLLRNGYQCKSVTIDDPTVATAGTSVSPLIVSGGGLDKFAPMLANETFDMNDYVATLNNATSLHSSVFGETWARNLQKAIADAEQLSGALDSVELTQNYASSTGDDDYVQKIKAVSSLILSHKERGSDRDVYFLSLGEWDHHDSLKPSLSREFTKLDEALTLLEGELKAQGLWNQVSVVMTSDFARTLTANSGEGSDHAWGGHYWMMGGSVKGGQIHGEYPSDITMNGPLNVGRGRLIPTLSWESVLTSAIEWMGIVAEEDLDYCMPNRKGTNTTLFGMEDVFQPTPENADK